MTCKIRKDHPVTSSALIFSAISQMADGLAILRKLLISCSHHIVSEDSRQKSCVFALYAALRVTVDDCTPLQAAPTWRPPLASSEPLRHSTCRHPSPSLP